MSNNQHLAIGLILSSFFHNESPAIENWSNWLGPRFDGSIDYNLQLGSDLEEIGTKWEVRVGTGWSAPITSKKMVFLHDRINDKENLTSYHIDSGKMMWRFSFDSRYRDDFGMENGPRSTPSISQGIIVTHSPDGLVHAVNIQDGKLKWKIDLLKEFGSPKGFFGRCASPLILGDKVILDVGGKTSGLVALSLLSGETIWKSKPYGNDYASVVPLKTSNLEMIVAFMRQGLVVVSASNGDEIYFDGFKSPINASVNAASPLVLNSGVFLSSCYEVGAGYWEFSKEDKVMKFQNKWKRSGVLDCHYSTPIELENYLYGFHGRQERGALLRCLRLSDGKVMWTAPPLGTGHLIRVGSKALCLTEKGEFIIFEPNPSRFKLIFRQQVLGEGRAHFGFSDGKILARDKRRLICLDLTGISK